MLTPGRSPIPVLWWEGSWVWPRLLKSPPAPLVLKAEPFSLRPSSSGRGLSTPVPAAFSKDVPKAPHPDGGLQGWWFLSSHCQSDRSLGQQPRQAGAHVLEGRRGFLARVPGPRSLHPTFTGSFAKSPLEIPSRRPACQTRTWPLGENGNSGGRGDPSCCAQITTRTPPRPYAAERGPNCQPGRKRKTPALGGGRGGQGPGPDFTGLGAARGPCPGSGFCIRFLAFSGPRTHSAAQTGDEVLESHPLWGTQRRLGTGGRWFTPWE